jgi:hypothetical protein
VTSYGPDSSHRALPDPDRTLATPFNASPLFAKSPGNLALPAQGQGQHQGQQGQPQTFSLSGSASLTLTLLHGGSTEGSATPLDPAGIALPGLGGTRAEAEKAEQFGLSLPSSVLPPVLQALNTLDLRLSCSRQLSAAGC